MTRILLGSAAALVVSLFAGQSAQAQHFGFGGNGYSGVRPVPTYPGGYGGFGGYGGSRYSQPHTHYVPGHFDRHRGHFHYVPAHTDLHVGGRRHAIDPWTGSVSPFHHHRD